MDKNKRNQQGTVATIGVYDGVHVGHTKVLEKVSGRARDLGLSSAVLTFDPHPDEVLGKLTETRFLLTTPREKHVLLANLGIDIEMVLEFTMDIGRLDAKSFVKKYLLQSLRLKELVIGHDFRMGKDRKGDRDMLRSLGEDCDFSVLEVEAVLVDGTPASSTRVRRAVSAGDMELAAKLLGRGYSLEGEVVKGDGIGAQIGFPTANLSLDVKKLLPPDGVYAAYAETGEGTYKAAVNVGRRPSVGGGRRQVEAHIVGLRDGFLARRLRLIPVARMRSERKFPEIKDLRKAISRDVEAIGQFLDTSTVKTFL
jgi:riboflavin kinase/FMN adenylyltransferase